MSYKNQNKLYANQVKGLTYINIRLFQAFIVWFVGNFLMVLFYTQINVSTTIRFSKMFVLLTFLVILTVEFFFMRKHRRHIRGDLTYFKVNTIVILLLFAINIVGYFFVPEPIYTFFFCAAKTSYILGFTSKFVSIPVTFLFYFIVMTFARIGQGHRARTINNMKREEKKLEHKIKRQNKHNN